MGQHLGVVEQCEEAIRALFRARSSVEGVSYDKLIKARFDGDSGYLATHGAKGLYYGDPGTSVRLCFVGGEFHLGGGTMEYQDFMILQEATAQEFRAADLPFEEMLKEQHKRHIICPAISFAQAV